MSSVDRGDILRLSETAADVDQAPDLRLESATSCSWLLRRGELPPETVILARAVLSRLVDDLKDLGRPESGYRDMGFWRRFDCTVLQSAVAAKTLTIAASFISAQLLFDAARHREAMPFFEKVLSSAASPEAVILACYNLEVLARQDDNLDLAERAIRYLTQQFSGILSPGFAAEVDHLHGHLLLLKGRYQRMRTLGFERLGVQYLARAAVSDPSYFSCYASSFAEHGDFLGSIEACLDILRQESFSSLRERDARLVRLELLFYLAYSLMAIGELSRAEHCFKVFAETSEAMDLLEARDHARLFLVKIKLKRQPMVEVDEATLTSAFEELRTLSFREALSNPVEGECHRYEQVLAFLRAVVGARRQDENHQSLKKLGQEAAVLLSSLAEHRPRILEGLIIGIGPEDLLSDVSAEATAAVLARVSTLSGLQVKQLTSRELPIAGLTDSPYVFVLWGDASTNVELGPTLASNVIPFSVQHSADGGLENATDFLLIGLAIVAIKRFWTQDQYVFGIVPCVESPATKFQRPKYSLDGLI